MKALATLALGLACAAGAVGAQTPDLASLRALRAEVPLPPEVVRVVTESFTWTRDGRSLVGGFDVEGEGVQVARIDPDGASFQCLSCGGGMEGEPWRISLFPDNQRFFVGTLPSVFGGAASSGANIVPQVGECSPSLDDCQSVAFSRVELPAIAGNVNDREPRLSPDGEALMWTIVRPDGFHILLGRLERTGDGYRVTEPRVLNPQVALETAGDWTLRLAHSEGKSFNRGDRVLYSSTRLGSGALDVFDLDLATGELTRLTHDLEWDEDSQFDPTRTFLVTASARHMHDQLRALAAPRLPTFIDGVTTLIVTRASLGVLEARSHVLNPWITTPAAEAAGESGWMLNDRRGGWAGQATSSPWSPDGTRVAWAERDRDQRTRVIVLTFPDLPPQPPACLDPAADPTCRTPVPTWAPLVEDYPMVPFGTFAVPGPEGGEARVTFNGIAGRESGMELVDYATEDGRVLNGFARVEGQVQTEPARWTQDIAITGTATGRATVDVSGEGSTYCGVAETVMDGERLVTRLGQFNPACGMTPPEACPDGADADGTATGDCSGDGLPPRWLIPAAE